MITAHNSKERNQATILLVDQFRDYFFSVGTASCAAELCVGGSLFSQAGIVEHGGSHEASFKAFVGLDLGSSVPCTRVGRAENWTVPQLGAQSSFEPLISVLVFAPREAVPREECSQIREER